MSLINDASLILTPNAVKEGKLYSIIPLNGNGDMTVVRAIDATKVNSLGLIESVAANVPRLNYDGSCPSILVEPQRTNLLLNSVWAGGGSLPTSWLFSTTAGTSTPVTSIKNTNVTAYRFTTSTTRQDISQTFAIALNQVIAFSVYVESVTTAIPISQMLRIGPTGAAAGTTVFLKNNVVVSSALNIEAGFTYSIVLTCTTAGDFQFRVGSGVNSNVTGNFVLSMPQAELGVSTPTPVAAYSTSFIPTTTQIITRNADIISKSNIFTNNLITSAGGTFFIELNNNISFARDASRYSIGIDTAVGGITNGFSIKSTGAASQRLTIVKIIGSSQTNLYTTLTDVVKIAIDWNGTAADVFVNGVKVVTATLFTITNMQFLFATAEDVPKYIKSMMLFPRPLTDAECIALTTL